MKNTDKNTISFHGFWQGFKVQAESMKNQGNHLQMQQQLLLCAEKSGGIDEQHSDDDMDHPLGTPRNLSISVPDFLADFWAHCLCTEMSIEWAINRKYSSL